MLASDWKSWFKRVGRRCRKIRIVVELRRDEATLRGVQVTDATLPGKASQVRYTGIRTVNRHRWVGREYQGARENPL
jgi:hypothetical protein